MVLLPAVVLLRCCGLAGRIELSSQEEGRLGLQRKNMQLLVHVSGGAARGFVGCVKVEVPGLIFSDSKVAAGAVGAGTRVPLRTLRAGGFGDGCSGFLSSLVCASRALRRGCSFSMARGRFPVMCQTGWHRCKSVPCLEARAVFLAVGGLRRLAMSCLKSRGCQ